MVSLGQKCMSFVSFDRDFCVAEAHIVFLISSHATSLPQRQGKHVVEYLHGRIVSHGLPFLDLIVIRPREITQANRQDCRQNELGELLEVHSNLTSIPVWCH